MMLSDGMRLGATLKPQARGTLYDGVGTCALGAALDAIGKLEKAYERGVLLTPEMLGLASDSLLVVEIAQRNDGSLGPIGCEPWTREQIADWLVESNRDVLIPGTEPAELDLPSIPLVEDEQEVVE